VIEAGDPVSPSAVALPDGREAMAVFSSEDEARMFCCVGRDGANTNVRETSTSEVLLLLSGSPPKVKHVILDPIPEIFGGKLSELPTLDGERFARSFAGPGSDAIVRGPYA
jgi:hypothetical protein